MSKKFLMEKIMDRYFAVIAFKIKNKKMELQRRFSLLRDGTNRFTTKLRPQALASLLRIYANGPPNSGPRGFRIPPGLQEYLSSPEGIASQNHYHQLTVSILAELQENIEIDPWTFVFKPFDLSDVQKEVIKKLLLDRSASYMDRSLEVIMKSDNAVYPFPDSPEYLKELRDYIVDRNWNDSFFPELLNPEGFIILNIRSDVQNNDPRLLEIFEKFPTFLHGAIKTHKELVRTPFEWAKSLGGLYRIINLMKSEDLSGFFDLKDFRMSPRERKFFENVWTATEDEIWDIILEPLVPYQNREELIQQLSS